MLQNVHRILGNEAILVLTRGQETRIDVADLEMALSYRWCALRNKVGGYYAYARRGRGVYLHRLLMEAPKGKMVDHWNHDTLDNRRSNLRVVNNQVNCANRNGAYKSSKTGVRGVVWYVSHLGLGTPYWIFKCGCVSCKVFKYFPGTDDGYSAAVDYANKHHAAMMGGS